MIYSKKKRFKFEEYIVKNWKTLFFSLMKLKLILRKKNSIEFIWVKKRANQGAWFVIDMKRVLVFFKK
ncbi:MAG: hypothetical protein CM15mP109_09590 [Candidatus Dadabacteria bacterium]|nr:MAG: hypothetical protein CM15mP109_09590 [Candidatus Dadabacteria bacterium]